MKMGEWKYGGASLIIGIAIALPVQMRKQVVMLSKLRTDPEQRRQGHAQTLLCMVTAAADLSGKMLMLKVGEGEEGGASKQQLLSFYERHGFMPIQAEPLLMARPPISLRGISQSLSCSLVSSL